jgi:hypothetical protein
LRRPLNSGRRNHFEVVAAANACFAAIGLSTFIELAERVRIAIIAR